MIENGKGGSEGSLLLSLRVRYEDMGWMHEILRKPPPAQPGEVNYSLIDRFTLAHFGIGFAYCVLGFGFGITVFLAVAWEILENPLKVHLRFLFPHATADTTQNILGDTIAVLLGWVVCYYS